MATFGDTMGSRCRFLVPWQTQALPAPLPLSSLSCVVLSGPAVEVRGCAVCVGRSTLNLMRSRLLVETWAEAGPCAGAMASSPSVCRTRVLPSTVPPSLRANPVQALLMVNGHCFDPGVTATNPYHRSRSPCSARVPRSTAWPLWTCGCSLGP